MTKPQENIECPRIHSTQDYRINKPSLKDLNVKEKQDAMDTKEKKNCKTKKNEMHARVSRSIEKVSRIYRETTSMDRESVEDLSAKQKVSR